MWVLVWGWRVCLVRHVHIGDVLGTGTGYSQEPLPIYTQGTHIPDTTPRHSLPCICIYCCIYCIAWRAATYCKMNACVSWLGVSFRRLLWLCHIPMFRECHRDVQYEYVPTRYAYVVGQVCVGSRGGRVCMCSEWGK